MNQDLLKDIPNWETLYLSMVKDLTDRQKEILKGSELKSHEGMMYGSMYNHWKQLKGYE